MTAPTRQRVKGEISGGGRRGEVKGWSKASRRRLRFFLLTHELPGFNLYGCTFTLPGAELSNDDERRIFQEWSLRAAQQGWAAVWRLEVQKRGVRHWHLMAGVPDSIGAKEGAWQLKESWWKAMDSIGARTCNYWDSEDRQVNVGTCVLSAAVGAMARSADVEPEGNDGAWHRYLSDHCTKAKQEQIAKGKGRQWGIIGRRHFRDVRPDDSRVLGEKAYAAFRRAYERLATPHTWARSATIFINGERRKIRWKGDQFAKAMECVSSTDRRDTRQFLHVLGSRVQRARMGSAVSFCRPDTIKRLVAWAAALYPDEGAVPF